MARIEIRDLTHRFHHGNVGLQGINLDIAPGEFLVLAGANGSGKTTLLHHLNGLLQPDSGVVMLDGVAVNKNLTESRQKVGMVFQDTDSQIVGETVFADVAFGPENLRWPANRIQEAVDKALNQVGLNHLATQSPLMLSGGERRRLTIAGVFAMQPEIIVLDEPFANLDYPGVRSILQQIISLHRQGFTIIVSAHDLDKIIAHAQRLVIMKKGRIVADGKIPDILPLVEQFNIRLPYEARMGRMVSSWLN